MPIAGAGQPFEAVYGPNDNGLVGTIAVAVEDNDGVVVIGPTTADITEIVVSAIPTGIYAWNAPAAPATLGQYTIIWSPDGTWSEVTNSSPDELVVITPGATPPSPIPPPDAGGLVGGPCTSWVTGDDIAACCSTETSSGAEFDLAAEQASQLLYQLSGRQFSGLCGPRTVRPACDSCWCGYQILSRGYVIGPWDYGYPLLSYCDQCLISCSPSMIKLAGYPVREITQVKIDGDVIDATEYALLNYRYLVRKDNARWPVAQDLTVDDTEDSTFSISYTYGAGIPPMAAEAAAQLGCQIYQACNGGECALPTGVTRIIQQGLVIEKLAFTSWAFRNGEWRTGLPMVDAFLATYNPKGIQRRPVFWAPGRRQYAQSYGY
jgi:hypothetical protein